MHLVYVLIGALEVFRLPHKFVSLAELEEMQRNSAFIF